ncbi:unnamed protein product [Phytomonas sp. EM1]|nr:unnamed protein product [Phytomonas sp. EM1]|eukprot:CCW61087.1 unnamed protein product [Phytomonas sp. isolate EM1]
MGAVMSWAASVFAGKKATVLMLGLDAAGKTTLLAKLSLNETPATVPTVGFNVETVAFAGVTMHLWDVGGQRRLRGLWRHYYDGADAILFVIDSNDAGRLGEVRGELVRLLREPALARASLLLLCNKQDLPGRLPPAEIARRLGVYDVVDEDALGRYLAGRRWYVQGCCAFTGQGLFEGLDWLCQHLPEAT